MVIKGIYTDKSQNIRKLFSHTIFMLCLESRRDKNMGPINEIMKALIENMPKEDQSGSPKQQHCSEFFDLLCALIDQSEEEESGDLDKEQKQSR